MHKVGPKADSIATPSTYLHKVSLNKKCDYFVDKCNNCLSSFLIKHSIKSVSILKKAINTDANVFFYGNISPNGGKAKVPTVEKKTSFEYSLFRSIFVTNTN